MRPASNQCPECDEEHCVPVGQLTWHDELDVVLQVHQCSNCGVMFETVFEPVTFQVIEE
jgi:hypothetical protein